MRRRTAVLSASAALAMSLLLGACASEPEQPTDAEQSASATETANTIEPAATDDALPVTVNGEVNPTVKPDVVFTPPLSVTETSRKIIAPGNGDEITADDEVQFAYTLYAGSTGAELDTSYGKTDARFELGEITMGLARGLVGAHVGDRLAVAIAPEDGFGSRVSEFNQEGVDETTTMLMVADVVRIIPTMAEGTPVTPPANLPALTTDDQGVPTGFTISDPTPPADLVVQPLIEGTGPEITTGMNVKVQYLGAQLSDGTVFDQSWSRGTAFPFTIGQGQVIQGWDAGLLGQKVGSRVLLVIPAAQAYGDEPSQEGAPSGALVFVVDILDAY